MSYKEIPIGLAFDVRNGATPSSEVERNWNGNIPWITPADLGGLSCREIAGGARSITAEGYASCGAQLVPEGSLILSIRAPIGYVAIAKTALCFNQGCRGLIPRKVIRTDFAYWTLLAIRSQLEAAGQGTTFLELGRGNLRAEKIPVPPFETQQAIAEFLNCETTRIDQVIEKRESFLALIEEKKAALTVKALNGTILGSPAVGISGWFGILPEDWEILRAKYLFKERKDLSKTGDEELLTVSHLTGVSRRADKDVNMFLAESLVGYKLVSAGDVVVNTMWAWMGAMGISTLAGLASPSYGVYTPIMPAYEPKYLDLLLRSRPFVAEVNRRSKGVWSSRLRLYPDAFLDITFPVPSKSTQASILQALKDATTREDLLAKLSYESINRLREYRAALITAAITGQIDVTALDKPSSSDPLLDSIVTEMAGNVLPETEIQAQV